MESVSNMACSETDVLGNQTTSYNADTVFSTDVSGPVANFQEQENLNPNSAELISVSGVVSDTKCLNKMPSDYEDTSYGICESEFDNTVVGHEVQLPVKALSPTIFGNVAKVMKNLFSPAKAHGIFSLGASQHGGKHVDNKKISNAEIKILNANTSCRIEQLPLVEHKGSVSSSNLESNLCCSEDEALSLVTKNFSISVDTHNNTDDSYTSTVSRMEESFQSTVTHFDDCMQNVFENSINSANLENSVFARSMNDTIDASEHSLNDTLRRDISSSLIEDEELNVTFEAEDIDESFIPEIKNKELCSTNKRIIQENYALCVSSVQEGKESKNAEENFSRVAKEVLEHTMEIISSPKTEERPSFEELNLTDIPSSTTPSKQPHVEDTNFINSSFATYIPDTLNQSEEKGEEIVEPISYSCTPQDADVGNEDNLSQLATTIHFSEIVHSVFPKSSNVLPEKINTAALCAGLEKNFSTSTITISKNELDCINSCNTKDTQSPQFQLPLTENKSQILYSDIKKSDTENITNIGEEHSSGVQADDKDKIDLCGNEPLVMLEKVERKDIRENLKNSTVVDITESARYHSLESNSFELTLEMCKPCILEQATIDIFGQDFETLKRMENNFFPENELDIKPEECPVDVMGIPLASQKSYTVLHNLNPNLNRPVVPDGTSDIQVDKLNDIILGNRTFSDLNVLYNKNIHSDEISIPNTESEASTSNYFVIDTSKISTGAAQYINVDNAHLKTSDVEIPNSILIDTADESEFDKSAFLSSLESQIETEQIKADKDGCKYPEQEENSSSLSESNKDISEMCNSISEKTPKSESAIVEPSDSSIVSCGNSSEGDILFLGGKNEDKSNKTMLPELELSPLVKHISNSEAAKESCLGSIATSFTCEDVNPLLNVNFDGLLGETFVSDNSHMKDLGGNEEQTKDLNSNIELKNTESLIDTEIKDLRIDLDSVVSGFEKLNMNDSVNEETKDYNSDSDNSFCVTNKLNDTVSLDKESDLCESQKNVIKTLSSVTELTQLIEEQFTATDIEKICSVVDDIPELNLSKNIAIASQQFDKGFQNKILSENDNNATKANNFIIKDDNDLDFLDSIKGKPSSRDYSRESLFIKFDPLVQLKHSAILLDISEGDKENVVASPVTRINNISDSLISITPLKKNINITTVPPLTPTFQNSESKSSTEKLNKLRELQNEISRLREYYLQREEIHKEKIANYENEIAKLTGKACVLEDKLRESEEIEKSLVKKLNTQNEATSRLKSIIEEYMAYINKLTDEMQKSRKDNQKQISAIKEERDYYMNHLQSTEKAFSDVLNKYEKCKKAVEFYKKNEEAYKLNIENMKDKFEEYSEKIRGVQEIAAKEVNRLQEKINDLKLNHSQKISKFKAQLRITEFKVQTVQEALEQKIKENLELAGICDELIGGKECDR